MVNKLNFNSAPSFDEIVFEQRNHDYGAFDLRRSYEKHIIGGFIITISLLLLITGAALIKTLTSNHPVVIRTREMPEILSPHVFDLPNKKEISSSPIGGQKPTTGPSEKLKSTAMLVVNTDSMKIDEQKTPDTLSQNSILTKAPSGPVKSSGSGGNGIDSSQIDGKETAGITTQTYTDFPDVWPEFPGGQDGLFRFLRNNLRYPRGIAEEQGTVYAAFVVQADGKIGAITILKGIGGRFDQEVIRAISKMPNWDPGKQAGNNVSVRYKIPVKFSIQQ